jgi:uncharacterized protein
MSATPAPSRGNWICTFTGKRFHVTDPSIDEICIEDIAHALAMMCRFSGHVRDFYSVAEHSVHMSYLVPPEHAFEALMHDASEAYIVDIPRPLKYSPEMSGYSAIEERVQGLINQKFGLPNEMTPIVKHYDNVMLVTEQSKIRNHPDVLKLMIKNIGVEPDPNIPIRCWNPHMAKTNFLMRFNQLSGN